MVQHHFLFIDFFCLAALWTELKFCVTLALPNSRHESRYSSITTYRIFTGWKFFALLFIYFGLWTFFEIDRRWNVFLESQGMPSLPLDTLATFLVLKQAWYTLALGLFFVLVLPSAWYDLPKFQVFAPIIPSQWCLFKSATSPLNAFINCSTFYFKADTTL